MEKNNCKIPKENNDDPKYKKLTYNQVASKFSKEFDIELKKSTVFYISQNLGRSLGVRKK